MPIYPEQCSHLLRHSFYFLAFPSVDMNQVLILLICCIHIQATSHLFDTENGRMIEEYDCIYHTTNTSVKYCRRPTANVILDRSKHKCVHGGQRLSFQFLFEENISPDDILQWNVSLEQVDDYAYFIDLRQRTNFTINEYLCRCIEPGTFGKFCEYRFLDETTSFKESINVQFAEKERNHFGAQHHGDILCYDAPLCYSGLLCLDWRNICDGEQQCDGGYDELNCDLLEFNECDDDEYRCRNGMCIPEEYWLDGKFLFSRRSLHNEIFNNDPNNDLR